MSEATAASTPAAARTARWALDPSHSLIEFAVRHLMISTVKGRFGAFEGVITADPNDLTNAAIEVNIDVASIDTRDAKRDEHLRSADFFDAARFPQITFKSRKVSRAAGAGEYSVLGDLTIRGVTRPVTLEAAFSGRGKDPWGNERAAFSATGSIDRKDFGLTWNAALETGGVVVGDQVKISIEVEAVRQG